MHEEDHLNLVRLSSEQREALFRRLDQEETIGRAPHQERRTARRWSFRRDGISLTIEHADDSRSRFLILSRNLSAHGMAFIHGRFVHPTTRCRLVLRRADGEEHAITGHVLNCRHIEGALHEIRIAFDQAIEPVEFVETPTAGTDDDDGLPATTELTELRGRLLHVVDTDIDARLVEHRLAATGMSVTRVSGAEGASAAVKSVPYDVVLVEPAAGAPVVAIRHLRRSGFSGPVVLTTAEANPRRLADLAEGADFVLHKPFPPEELYLLLIRLLLQSRPERQGEVIYSTMDHDRDAADMLESYIDHARRVAERIEQALNEQNMDGLRAACLTIKGSAEGYGYQPLGQAADEALQLLDDAASVESAVEQIQRVTHMCRRLAVRDLRE